MESTSAAEVGVRKRKRRHRGNMKNLKLRNDRDEATGKRRGRKAKSKRPTKSEIRTGSVIVANPDDSSKKKKLKDADEAENAKLKSEEMRFDRRSLKDKMIDRLKGGRFRHLNQMLTTMSSADAKTLFENDRGAFTAYHQGYKLQVSIRISLFVS